MRVFGRFLCPAHLPAHPAHLWRSAAAAHGGVRQCSRSAARTRKSPVFARLSPFSNARPNARTPSVKRERPEALETRRRRKKTPDQRRAAVVIDTERARRRRGVGSNFRRFSELTPPPPPPQSLDFSAFFGLSHLFPPRPFYSHIFDTDLVTSQIFPVFPVFSSIFPGQIVLYAFLKKFKKKMKIFLCSYGKTAHFVALLLRIVW